MDSERINDQSKEAFKDLDDEKKTFLKFIGFKKIQDFEKFFKVVNGIDDLEFSSHFADYAATTVTENFEKFSKNKTILEIIDGYMYEQKWHKEPLVDSDKLINGELTYEGIIEMNENWYMTGVSMYAEDIYNEIFDY
jgi:hypothetical protein